ncbi:MAG: L,D-transpeptidase ErfK/SrfK [Gaiellaceae bacterium]|jgi:lipoprotein-anchoring transpeptidase ErfK/SrfK|nr:L,D-transpeptidase ErfK/SrfK [Gaiellaceae bacterium]
MSAPTIATPSSPSAEPNRPSRKRLALVIAVVLGVVVVLLAAILLYDHSRRDRIANGVTIDGVAVGGLSEASARTKVQRELIGPLNKPVTIRSGHRTWTLDPRHAGVVVDEQELVARAVGVSREGSIFSRTFRDLFGGTLDRDVKLHVGYSLGAVRALTAKVRAGVNRPARDATVSPSASGLDTVPSANGLVVEHDKLGARVEHALASTGSGREVSVPTHVLKPAVTTTQLAGKYPGYIVVDRSEFRLRFYEHLKLAKTYEIAVGMEGLETPAGLHHIEWEQVDPPWYVPNKAWAGSLAGTVVPPGPADPLKARFMSFEGGAGIHGIDPGEYSSIGHDASHGCIRMRIPDVIALYDKSPVGTPVYII